MGTNFGYCKVETDTLLGVYALGTVHTRTAVLAQFVLPMSDPKAAWPLEPRTVQIVEAKADPELHTCGVSLLQCQLPGIDPLVQKAPNDGLLSPLADVKKALPVDPLGLGHSRGKEGHGVTKAKHVADDGPYLGSDETTHGFVDKIIGGHRRSGIEEETAVVVVEQRRK
jgi:hypothetical protein